MERNLRRVRIATVVGVGTPHSAQVRKDDEIDEFLGVRKRRKGVKKEK